MRGGGAVIIIDRSAKAAIIGGDSVVEFAQATQALEPTEIEMAGKQARFVAHSAAQCPQKVGFVEAVGRDVQFVGGGCEIERWATGGDSAELRRGFFVPCPFTGQLQYQVAAHREANQRQA